MKTTRLRVTLKDVEPRVQRVVDVPATSTLPELHDILQAAIGWTNSHLHEFESEQTHYGPPDEDADWQEDETAVRLKDLAARFAYRYDFGDGWEHDVEVLGLGGNSPGCVSGEGSCPPEDCGGPPGYAELLQILADPTHERHAHLREWAGDLPTFDLEGTDERVRQTSGEVPATVRFLLELTADGVRLTPGGRLPRVVVRRMQELRPQWHPLQTPAMSEDDLYPLTVLHSVLREVGLLRLRHGVLSPTKAAGDDLEVVRRLRTWWEPEGFDTVLTRLAVAVLQLNGPQAPNRLAADVQPLIGPGWSRRGRDLSVDDVRELLYGVAPVLKALDVLEADWARWQVGPSAYSLLPRTTL